MNIKSLLFLQVFLLASLIKAADANNQAVPLLTAQSTTKDEVVSEQPKKSTQPIILCVHPEPKKKQPSELQRVVCIFCCGLWTVKCTA